MVIYVWPIHLGKYNRTKRRKLIENTWSKLLKCAHIKNLLDHSSRPNSYLIKEKMICSRLTARYRKVQIIPVHESDYYHAKNTAYKLITKNHLRYKWYTSDFFNYYSAPLQNRFTVCDNNYKISELAWLPQRLISLLILRTVMIRNRRKWCPVRKAFLFYLP